MLGGFCPMFAQEEDLCPYPPPHALLWGGKGPTRIFCDGTTRAGRACGGDLPPSCAPTGDRGAGDGEADGPTVLSLTVSVRMMHCLLDGSFLNVSFGIT